MWHYTHECALAYAVPSKSKRKNLIIDGAQRERCANAAAFRLGDQGDARCQKKVARPLIHGPG